MSFESIRIRVVAMVLLALVAFATSASAVELVSGQPNGLTGIGPSQFPTISRDGRYVVWQSTSDLGISANVCIASLTNETVYLRDLVTGVTEAVGDGWAGAASDGGRYVAYFCGADSLGFPTDLCVRDRVADTNAALGVPAVFVDPLAISADGRFVAYRADHGLTQIDVYDRCESNGVPVGSCVPGPETASVSTVGIQGNSSSRFANMSADGRYVVFESGATNLVAGPANFTDLYVRDRVGHATERVSVGTGGAAPDCSPAGIGRAGISDDGRYVAFIHCARNWAPVDPRPIVFNAFVRDRLLDVTELASKNTAGAPDDFGSSDADISGDGRYVMFVSRGTNLDTPTESEFDDDAYLRDRTGGTTTRVSKTSSGDPAEYPSGASDFFAGIRISGDGHSGVFATTAANFGADHHHARMNVYAWSDCAAAPNTCGNGIIYATCEQCDDANAIDGDGCDTTCRTTGCGSGVVTAGEACDDGNLVDDDGCDSNCTATACGNGIRTTGEQCDDGNLVNGDGCSSTCVFELASAIAGSGSKTTDCWHEWRTQPPPLSDNKGLPRRELRCTDDDSSCDFGTAGDHACTFHIALCFNVLDPRLPDCTPDEIETLTVKKPIEAAPKNAVEAAIRDAFEAKFASVGACVGGACTKPASSVDFLCSSNADCDEVGGDGVCKGRFGALLEVIEDTNACTGYMDVVVPLKQKNGVFSSNKQSLAILVEPTPDQATGKLRKGDGDKLKLVCNAP